MEYVQLVAEGMPEEQASKQIWKAAYMSKKRCRNNPLVAGKIAEIKQQIQDDAKIKRDEVVEGFLTAINHAKMQGDAAGQIKGWVEIAKMHGYYEPDKKIVEHRVEIQQRHYEEMSLEELMEMANAPDPITLSEAEYEVIEMKKEDVGTRKEVH